MNTTEIIKHIPETFTSNPDGCGECTFSFVKREENTMVTMYKRTNNETQHVAYEVFVPKIAHKGDKLPNNTFVEESSYRYPHAASFGRTAFYCMNELRAEERFNSLIEHLNESRLDTTTESVSNSPTVAETPTVEAKPKGKRGRPSVNRTFDLPKTPFKLNDLLAANPNYNKNILYVHINKAIKSGTIKIIGSIPNKNKKGKNCNIYQLI